MDDFTSETALGLLESVFGHDEFKTDLQREAVEAVLRGESSVYLDTDFPVQHVPCLTLILVLVVCLYVRITHL